MQPILGAQNMLINCAEAQAGERLLIAYEPSEFGYYDADAVPCVIKAAQQIGMAVETVDVGFCPYTPCLSAELMAQFERADIIVFLARLGDQLRFSDMPAGKRIVVSFALDRQMFGSAFGTTHHSAMIALKEQVNHTLAQAHYVRVTCAQGTDFAGKPDMPMLGGDCTIRRFPMSIFQPVPADSFSGRVALCGFLTGTGTLYYDDYTLEFDGPVHAIMHDGQLVGFDGSARDVNIANAHYDRVSRMFGIERNFIHSWHAGIHPGCGYTQEARTNYERWGGSAFGNPRLLHFHTCGRYAPGEISWNMVDPTIEIDGVPIWEHGVFHPERMTGGQAILDQYPCAARIFAAPDPQIGLSSTLAPVLEAAE